MGLFYCEKYRVILPTRDIQDSRETENKKNFSG